jgi:tetratricopeptide (TPR) repeat protein
MYVRVAIALLVLSTGIAPLSGQPSSEERWRSTLAAADRLQSEGRTAEAERMFESALDEARRLAPDPAAAATVYNNLAGLYQDMGRCDPAVRAYQRSIDLWEKAGARVAPYLLRTANHLVGLYLECGAVQDAERHHRALVAPLIAQRAGRDRDADVAQALTNLGSIEYEKRKYSVARSLYEEALAIRERISGEPSTETGILLNNNALALLHTGDVDRALADSRRSVATIESTAGPSSALLVTALVNAANVCLIARLWSDAEPLLERALTMARGAVGEEHLLTATVLSRYAVLLKAQHRNKQAADLEDQARGIRMRLGYAGRQTVDARELARGK